jgi:uncharacterized protein
MFPDYDEIVQLHKKCAPDSRAFEIIFTHSTIVRDIALYLASKNNLKDINIQLIEAGALLHDIGTYELYENGKFDRDRYITHGVLGYEILRKEGYPESLCRIASNHTGAGITRGMIKEQKLPLPDNDYVANSIEEKLVMYADKFHSKTPRFNTYESYHKFSERFGKEATDRFEAMAKEFGLPDLEYFSTKYDQPIV